MGKDLRQIKNDERQREESRSEAWEVGDLLRDIAEEESMWHGRIMEGVVGRKGLGRAERIW